jgi:hypothetical protein
MLIFSQPSETIRVVRGENVDINSPDDKTIDKYSFNFSESDVSVCISIPKRISLSEQPGNSIIRSNITSSSLSKKVSVPILDILGQTLIDGSDIGNIIFIIQDEFQYYDNIPSKFNKCGTYEINPDQLQITIFEKSCPKIVSVVIGKGKTWYEKTEYIFRKLGKEKIGANFGDFRIRLFFYSMLKFILFRLLYGKFDINFLLRKYNDKFLNYLGKSRFCKALPLFIDPTSIIFGYDKYFKLDIYDNDKY